MTTTVPAAEMVANLETAESPSPESIAAARAAVAAEIAAAAAAIFEPVAARPRSADDVTTYQWNIDRFPHSAFTTKLLEMHRASLETSPGVASMCRTIEACEDAMARAGAVANPLAAASAGAAAVRSFQLGIARQLCEGCTEPSAARDYLAAVDLEARLDALQHRVEEREAAEAAAAEEARRAEVRAKRAERTARIAEAAQAEQTARAGYESAVRTHQRIRAESLRERVAASGLTEIRDHLGRLWAVKDLILVAGDGSAELPPHYELGVLERALDRHEAGQTS